MSTRRSAPLVVLRLALLGVAAGTLAGCGWFMEAAANNAGLESPSKLVEGKVPPDLLIASDGSECRVPESRFDHIEPGDHITCVWTNVRGPDRVLVRPPRDDGGGWPPGRQQP